MALRLRLAGPADVPSLVALEAASYPADEAASPERIALRVSDASSFFLVLEKGGTIVGFVNGTCVTGDLTAETMAVHNPHGSTLCIHSVVVSAQLRGRGLGSWMLARYIRHVATAQPQVLSLQLLAHSEKVAMYARLGFEAKGTSSVVWGSVSWVDMVRALGDADRTPVFIRANAFALPVDAPGGLQHFTGGPAGVVILPGLPLSATASDCKEAVDVRSAASGMPPAQWMQSFAAELNISTTAFVTPLPHDAGAYAIRWFTPTGELPLCGHATLAAAHALWTQRGHAFLPRGGDEHLSASELRFHSLSGLLHASALQGGGSPLVQLHFPRNPPSATPDEAEARRLLAPGPDGDPSILAQCLGLSDAYLAPIGALADAMGRAPSTPPSEPSDCETGVAFVATTGIDTTVELASHAFLRMRPDVGAMTRLLAPGSRILTVTTAGTAASQIPHAPRAPVGAAYDCVSRVFMPRGGFEDPVCGAAHVQLASHWAGRGAGSRDGGGVCRIRAFQASPRGGEIALELDAGGDTVRLAGRCLTTVVGSVAAPMPSSVG